MPRGLILALGLLVIVACAGAVSLMEDSLHVSRRVRSSGGETVEIAARDRVNLRASWLVPAQAFNRCVIVLHGHGDSRAGSVGFAPMLIERGYAVLAPDSRAHGESSGSLVTYGLLERYDALAWAQWMRSKGCAKVYGLGESLGASVLLQAAATERAAFRAIVAESPFADLQDAAETRLIRSGSTARVARFAADTTRLYARLIHGMDLQEASPLRTFGRVKTPVLLIHGEDDDQTPAAHSIRLTAANPMIASLWLVPGVRHQSAYSKEPLEWRRRVLSWFQGH